MNVIAQVLAPSGKVAVLLPVKEGDTITNDVETEMVTAIPQRVKEKFTTQEVIPVSSLNFLSVSISISYLVSDDFNIYITSRTSGSEPT